MQIIKEMCYVNALQACGALPQMRDRIEAVSYLFLNHPRDEKDISMI